MSSSGIQPSHPRDYRGDAASGQIVSLEEQNYHGPESVRPKEREKETREIDQTILKRQVEDLYHRRSVRRSRSYVQSVRLGHEPILTYMYTTISSQSTKPGGIAVVATL